MKPLCADKRIWGGAPPEEYYIPIDKQTKAQRIKFKAWQDSINKKTSEFMKNANAIDKELKENRR